MSIKIVHNARNGTKILAREIPIVLGRLWPEGYYVPSMVGMPEDTGILAGGTSTQKRDHGTGDPRWSMVLPISQHKYYKEKIQGHNTAMFNKCSQRSDTKKMAGKTKTYNRRMV